MLRTPVNNLICLFSCKWLLLKPCLEIWLKSILIWTAHDCFRLWLTDLLSIWQFQGMTQYCLWVERNWGHKGLKQLVGWRLAGSWTVGEAEAWGKASQDTQSPHQLGLLTRPSRPTKTPNQPMTIYPGHWSGNDICNFVFRSYCIDNKFVHFHTIMGAADLSL